MHKPCSKLTSEITSPKQSAYTGLFSNDLLIFVLKLNYEVCPLRLISCDRYLLTPLVLMGLLRSICSGHCRRRHHQSISERSNKQKSKKKRKNLASSIGVRRRASQKKRRTRKSCKLPADGQGSIAIHLTLNFNQYLIELLIIIIVIVNRIAHNK